MLLFTRVCGQKTKGSLRKERVGGTQGPEVACVLPVSAVLALASHSEGDSSRSQPTRATIPGPVASTPQRKDSLLHIGCIPVPQLPGFWCLPQGPGRITASGLVGVLWPGTPLPLSDASSWVKCSCTQPMVTDSGAGRCSVCPNPSASGLGKTSGSENTCPQSSRHRKINGLGIIKQVNLWSPQNGQERGAD
jgi:hypothetical protein